MPDDFIIEDEILPQASQGCLWTTFSGNLLGEGRASSACSKPRAAAGSPPSFWSLLQEGSGFGLNPLDAVLEQPDCSIETLLQQEDVLQELRANHQGLIQRLSRPDAALALIDFITKEPSEQLGGGPSFVASQILAWNTPELFEAWVSPDHPEILDRFWAFLDETPAESVSAVIAGYFAGVAAALLERRPEEVTSYLKQRGGEALFERFLERLHSRSLAELLAFLSCAECSSRIIFEPRVVVERLVKLLESPTTDREMQENVALVLGGIIAQGPSLCFAEDLCQLFAGPEMVARLMRLILQAEEPSRASAAASVLAGAMYHTSGLVPQPPEPPPTMDSTEHMSGCTPADVAGVSGPLSQVLPEPVPLLRSISSRSNHGSHAPPPNSGNQLATSVCTHFADLRGFLEEAVGCKVSPPPKPRPGKMGSVLEVILLLTLLVKAHRDVALVAFQKEPVLSVCIKALFFHPWSTLLHNAVIALFSEVLCIVDSTTEALFIGFLSSGGVMESIIAEFLRHQAVKDEAGVKIQRVGYMGHLHQLCCEVRGFVDLAPKCGIALAKLQGWWDRVLPAIEAISRLHAEELGGSLPAHLPGLAQARPEAEEWPEFCLPRPAATAVRPSSSEPIPPEEDAPQLQEEEADAQVAEAELAPPDPAPPEPLVAPQDAAAIAVAPPAGAALETMPGGTSSLGEKMGEGAPAVAAAAAAAATAAGPGEQTGATRAESCSDEEDREGPPPKACCSVL